MWYIGAAGGGDLLLGHRSHGRLRKDGAGGLSGLEEDPARPCPERSIEQLHELEHGDLVGGAGEAVAALHAPLRT